MKQIFDINYCLSLEDEIYNQTTYLPAMVFKKKYDNYFFFSDGIVRCSSECDDFAKCIMNFVKESNTIKFSISYLRDTINSNKYQLSIDDTSEDYINAMNFEIPQSVVALNSPMLTDGIGIYSESKEWAIYSEEAREIAILGTYSSFVPLIIKSFKGLILTPSKIEKEMEMAYHSSSYSTYEKDIRQIFNNYLRSPY